MPERDDPVLAELRAIREHLADILRAVGSTVAEQGPDDILTCEEAAAILRLQPDTLRRGLAGTRRIARHSSRPVTFRRFEIEKFVRERAQEKREEKSRPQRISLVRRKKDAA